MVQAEAEERGSQQPVKQKRGILSRFRLPRRKSQSDKREGTPSPPPPVADASRESLAITPEMPPRPKQRKSRVPDVREIKLEQAPTAKEAAFGGPPRYDWIDIETAAAIKVQAAFRRNKALRDLEQDGLTTAAIRNSQRRREARQGNSYTAEIPSIFQCCGVGLAFGDATEEDYEASRQHDKKLYEERKKARERHEEELRQSYGKTQRAKQTSVQETIEVVEEPEV